MSTKERTNIKKGRAQFTLVGTVKRTDKSFTLDHRYDSGWIDNSMYIGVDCGNNNTVYAEMRGGYFLDETNKKNIIYAFSKDKADDSGKRQSVEIAWEDRFDKQWFDEVSPNSFLTVGIEKDNNDKTLYKQFLSAYDAVAYLHEHLENGMTVNVKGNLQYSTYNGGTTIKKEITSIALSSSTPDNYHASFTQSLLIDSNTFSAKWTETADKNGVCKPLTAYVIDYLGKVKIDDKTYEIKKNIAYQYPFELLLDKKLAASADKIVNLFKTKRGKVTEAVVEGNIVESIATTTVSIEDIPDDIKTLINLGLVSEQDWLDKQAIANGAKTEKHLYVTRPAMLTVTNGDSRRVTTQIENDKYDESDLYFYEQALIDAGYSDGNDSSSAENDETESETDGKTSDDDVLSLLNGLN